MSVRERFYYFQTLLIFKCIHGSAPDYLINNVIMEFEVCKIETRKHAMNIYLPLPDCEFHKTKLFYRGAIEWNRLPGKLKDCHNVDTLKSFLRIMSKMLLECSSRPHDVFAILVFIYSCLTFTFT